MNENNHLRRVLSALYGSFDYKLERRFRENNHWFEVETWEYWEVIV